MRNILAIAAVAVLALGAAAPARAQGALADEAQVRELLTVMKADQNMRDMLPKMLDQVTAALSQRVPDMASKDRDEVMQLMRNAMVENVGLLIEALVPVYRRNFTDAEIAGLIQFMKTPVGQSYVAKMPKLGVESLQVGLQAGKVIAGKAAEQAVKRLREKGYKI
jgi:hypothetical protein